MVEVKLGSWSFMIIWEFQVKPGEEARFKQIYGANGSWSRLFSRSDGYSGTELARDPQRSGRYMTMDFWASRTAYERFMELYRSEYAALDVDCEGMTEREAAVGHFERLIE